MAAILAACVAIASPIATSHPEPDGTVRVIQINMCNSGFASCYSGRALAGTLGLLHARRPGVATLNEVCRDDLATIRRETGFTGIFTPSGAQRCANGSEYGNAVVFPAGTPLGTVEVTEYARQDPGVERRTLTCVRAGRVTVCVTHLTPGPSRFGQAAQMASIVARHAALGATVLGGDWNIAYPGAERVVPGGMVRTDDGNVQNIAATDNFRVVDREVTTLGWTDHPALEVHLWPRRVGIGGTGTASAG